MEKLERWHDFFVLVGTAGATLVALLFVAVSLGVGFLTDGRAAATRAFFSPVVVHFTAIFLHLGGRLCSRRTSRRPSRPWSAAAR